MGFKVAKKYRTNKLSHIDGSFIVRVIKENGTFDYNNIKDPDAYINKIKKNKNVKQVYIVEN